MIDSKGVEGFSFFCGIFLSGLIVYYLLKENWFLWQKQKKMKLVKKLTFIRDHNNMTEIVFVLKEDVWGLI